MILAASATQAIAQSPVEGVVRDGPSWFVGLGLFSLALAVLHLYAPVLRRWLAGHSATVRSLGGGMALGYVFLHLIPELDSGHALLGRMIFVVPVVAFMVFYGLRKYLTQAGAPNAGGGEARGDFPLALGTLWVYNALIVYGTPAGLAHGDALRAAPLFIALGLHLVHAAFSLGSEFPRAFDRMGRYLLALAPIAGWLAIVVDQKADDAINDMFVALLAGALLYTVFAEELPEARESRYGWFVLGVLLFSAAAAPTAPS
ncbi:MAG: hypothetical protein R3357_04155 [Burkholderiales bacterium]|nr:hypothetical protein [Burkholderiales bacterium]